MTRRGADRAPSMTHNPSLVSSSSKNGGVTWSSGGFLGALLVLPGLVVRSADRWVSWGWIVVGWVLWSGITYQLYRVDKRRAEEGGWRIPEATLHLAELLGGWPGAYLAQRVYRHKTSKATFQVVFWLIVLAHQFLAADYLAGWKFSKAVFSSIKALVG